MVIEIRDITIDRIIFHAVPSKHAGSTGDLTLSEATGEFGPGATGLFRRKLTSALATRARPIVLGDSADSDRAVVPGRVLRSLSRSNPDFIEDSRIIARRLFSVQPGSSPPGILAIAECTISDLPSFAIAKLEHDEGTQMTLTDQNGQVKFVMEYLDKLMLTGKARLFKASLFVLNSGIVEGRVYDDQTAQGTRRGEVASYFLRDFLGCKLRDDPAQVTKSVYGVAEEWLNSVVEDPSKQARYLISLLSEMRRDSGEFDPRSFALEYLDPEDGSEFY